MKGVMRSASKLLMDKESPEREIGNVESVATTLVRNDTDAGSVQALPVVSSRPWTRAAKRAAEEAQRPRTVVTTSGVGHASELVSSAEKMDTVDEGEMSVDASTSTVASGKLSTPSQQDGAANPKRRLVTWASLVDAQQSETTAKEHCQGKSRPATHGKNNATLKQEARKKPTLSRSEQPVRRTGATTQGVGWCNDYGIQACTTA
ncbi:hypothetical protein GN244_ATG20951 [Phytophthora infestans]|uniref:Uncharacterized protein n=1 Tax=Phytophthora infestans TaxID=4787 RepID=A0A833WHC6_PHYIN|nr:hypothetical protein GN244_ATG20951 [Phytophthora infestans]